jgi:hypothetical protein
VINLFGNFVSDNKAWLNESDFINICKFNEKVDVLSRLRFTRYFFERCLKNGRRCFNDYGEMELKLAGMVSMGDEALEAFLLTFRLFVQNDLSIRKFQDLYDKLPYGNMEKCIFGIIRQELNDYLDRTTIDENGVIWTKEDVMYNFLYGGYAHVSDDESVVIARWKSRTLYSHGWSQFILSLHAVFNALLHIQNLNNALILNRSLW